MYNDKILCPNCKYIFSLEDEIEICPHNDDEGFSFLSCPKCGFHPICEVEDSIDDDYEDEDDDDDDFDDESDDDE